MSGKTRSGAVSSAAVLCAVVAWGAGAGRAQAQIESYLAPASYYSSVTTQTGSALKTQLTTIMSTGHVQTNYGQARDFMPITDANPNNLTQMFMVYNRNVVTKASATAQGFVGIYDSREHVWPDSLQGDNTSNATTDSRGDIHMLKPLDQATNSTRSNNYYWGFNDVGRTSPASGSARNVISGNWYPGDLDRGDVARICFYGATRWSSRGLNLVAGTSTSTGFTMGDLTSLVRFNYIDAPDLFEMRRNDVIYRGDDVRTAGDDVSNWTGTNNRNAYIDHPEYVWSVFVNQTNNTRLSVGTAAADGSSAATVNLGRVLRGAAVPAGQGVTVTRTGTDGTYFGVTAAGGATSSVTGNYNAVPVVDGVANSAAYTGTAATLTVGLSTSTGTAGLKTGTVTIDNLDVTTAGGAGRGANDGNDVVTVSLAVLDASNPSFAAGSDIDTLNLDFGFVVPGAELPFSLTNLASALGSSLTARLDLDSVLGSGDTTSLLTDLTGFTNFDAGLVDDYTALVSPDALPGLRSATYTLNFSDEDLPGTVATSHLTLNLSAFVKATIVPEPAGLVFLPLAAFALAPRPPRPRRAPRSGRA